MAHYPIGVLYDLHVLSNAPASFSSASVGGYDASTADAVDPAALPWQLTVHLSQFPADKIFRTLPGPAATDPPRDFYMAQLKESDLLRHGSTKRVMSLSTAAQDALWAALRATDHDAFWAVNAGLLGIAASASAGPTSVPTSPPDSPRPPSSSSSSSPTATTQGLRHVPFRLYYADGAVAREVVGPCDPASGREFTLHDLLRICAPMPPGTSAAAAVITHGVALPLDTPLPWLAWNFAYPDNFVHLVAVAADHAA
ncbi:autophagy protein 5 [Cladochytrium tenue]|nr:autophagy protein 5 [Cladochytrium tenue]